MAEKTKILIQLDGDSHASVFDRVVAIDSGIDHLLSYSRVQPDHVTSLVHGAMFTRGIDDLKHTAIFVGGSDVVAAERVAARVRAAFFGPFRVSMLVDPNGANTTAAAAVLAANRTIGLEGERVLVLGATGPVGQRLVRLLAKSGALVRVGSRDLRRATEVSNRVAEVVPEASLTPVATASESELAEALGGVTVAIAAGAPGVCLIPKAARMAANSLRVAVDLNAVPPMGIAGLELHDRGTIRDGVVCFGGIGVGALKMKIHKVCIRRLFESNDAIIDTEAVHAIGQTVDG